MSRHEEQYKDNLKKKYGISRLEIEGQPKQPNEASLQEIWDQAQKEAQNYISLGKTVVYKGRRLAMSANIVRHV